MTERSIHFWSCAFTGATDLSRITARADLRMTLRPFLLVALISAAGCTVDIADLRGRACDEAHPCAENRVCVDGTCAEPQGFGGSAGGGSGGGCVSNAFVGTACSVGVGECRKSGAYVCVNEVAECSVGPGVETPEVCDTLDNDCDGVIDDVANCLYTIAGRGPPNLIDGPPLTARFAMPQYLTLSPADGDLYVPDRDNHAIRRVPLDGGAVTTVAGNGRCGFQDGPAANAQFCEPTEVVFNASGDFYISDTGNHRIRKYSNGTVTTVAGSGVRGTANGAAATAQFNGPAGLFLLANQDLLIADRLNHRIRRYVPGTAQVSTESGTNSGSNEGTRATLQFDQPNDVVVDAAGTLFVTEYSGDRVRLVPTAGQSRILAGSTGGLDGYAEGIGAAVQFADPGQLTIDEPNGLLFLADTQNYRVRAVPLDGGTTFPVVGATSPGFNNGTATTGNVQGVSGFANTGSRWIFADDTSTLRLAIGPPSLTFPNTTLEDFAGISPDIRSTDGAKGASDIYRPLGLEAGPDGSVYFTDPRGDLVRRLLPDGTVQTLVGDPFRRTQGFANGSFAVATLTDPRGLAFGPDGKLYVGEGSGDSIRVLDFATQLVTRLAGNGSGSAGHVNGALATSRFSNARHVRWAKDSTGRDILYVNDYFNRVIRKIDVAADSVTDFAGTPNQASSVPVNGGLGVGRLSSSAGGMDVDAQNNLWIADNVRVRKVDPMGVLSSPFPAAPGQLFDVSVSGDRVFAVGDKLIVEYQLSTSAEVRRLVTRAGFRDGLLSGAVGANSPGSYAFVGVKAFPQYILVSDEAGGRIRRLWR